MSKETIPAASARKGDRSWFTSVSAASLRVPTGSLAVRLSLTGLLACAGFTSAAFAGPDACQSNGSGSYTCSGNQSDGITVGASGSPPDDATLIEVENLTPNSGNAPYTGPFIWNVGNPDKGTLTFNVFPDSIVLAPATGSAIEFANIGKNHSDPAADMTLRFTGTIESSTDSAAIDSSATGYFGKNYNSTSVDTGHRGGDGGAGGSISVRLSEPHNGASATNLTSSVSDGIDVLSEGGKGGKGEDSSLDQAGAGGTGGNSGRLALGNSGTVTANTTGTAISLQTIGGQGGDGGSGYRAGGGGAGGIAGGILLDFKSSSNPTVGSWNLTVTGDDQYGFYLLSQGGHSSHTGTANTHAGPTSGAGGTGGAITANNGVTRTITVTGSGSTAFSAKSAGGDGAGGGNSPLTADGSDAGAGGDGNAVTIAGIWNVMATGINAAGIAVSSVGGFGGRGGNSSLETSGGSASGGHGGNGGAGGVVTFYNDVGSTVLTSGVAISVLSEGGAGGEGGNGDEQGGNAGHGGDGNAIYLDTNADGNADAGGWTVSTTADDAYGFVVTSRGGIGGDGERGGEQHSGSGGTGGGGGGLQIGNVHRKITTSGEDAHAFFITSIGGEGGEGAENHNVGSSGHGGAGGFGGHIRAFGTWDVLTTGSGSIGLRLRSDGGNGGLANESDLSVGGGGGAGGHSGALNLVTTGQSTLTTTGTGIDFYSHGGTGGAGAQSDAQQAGDGGAGGDSEQVVLDMDVHGNVGTGSWTITISDDSARGIVIDSKGGAGGIGGISDSGNAHDAGNGGNGGNGGNVILADVVRTIKTSGSSSSGLIATSGGGTGGNGAYANATGSGGTGGNGGSAGSVTVGGTWSITATGSGAEGGVVQSTGGAGGAGGESVLNQGGHGGTGGQADDVYVLTTWSSDITVTDNGLRLQSEGGAGGTGGRSNAEHVGDGGAGGGSGDVNLDVDQNGNIADGEWTITTSGDSVFGITAASQGGIGGTGGESGSANAFDAGTGGAGGDAGNVTTGDVSRSISLSGTSATGFSFASAGGDGGHGGTASATGSGGKGGAGGKAASVAVAGTWKVTATGNASDGGVVQSTGGDGGTGGESALNEGGLGGPGGQALGVYVYTEKTSTIDVTGNGLLLLSQGGTGGTGGNSSAEHAGSGGNGGMAGNVGLNQQQNGDVTTGHWKITTSGANAFGLSAGSMGGAGGHGGVAENLNSKSSGDGGTGGTAGDVSIRGILHVEAKGSSSRGVLIQSQGGAGGRGANASADSGGNGGAGGFAGAVELRGSETATIHSASSGLVVRSAGGAGGNGGQGSDGSGGNGGDGGGGANATINTGSGFGWTITTSEQSAPGLSIVSSGGNAGVGGESTNGTKGGNGGNGGDGGIVEATLGLTTVSTSQASSGAVYAGSLGGLSAKGGSDPNNQDGGNGGNGGDGANVTLSGTFDLATVGGSSPGLQAESIGADGNLSGEGNADGNGGNAGDVQVTVEQGSTLISTMGEASPGILAQSLGGAVATGTSGLTIGVAGTAGSVSVVVQEMSQGITTIGDQSNGITAISSGLGFSTPPSGAAVKVGLHASIQATGGGSHGIFAESTASDDSSEPVPIVIAISETGSVLGGAASGSSSEPDGVGIYVVNGTQNTLTNDGEISTVQGTEGTAVLQTGPSTSTLHVTNNGTIIGSVITNGDDPGATAPTATLDNSSSGLINAGRRIDAAFFDNAGTFAIGGATVATTTIAGDYTQSLGGVLALSLDLTQAALTDRIDQVDIDGMAEIDGSIVPTIIAFDIPAAGHELPFLEAGDLTIASSLAVQDTAAVDYSHRQEDNQLLLSYAVDFASDRILDATNDNQDDLVRVLDALYRNGTLDSDLGLALINIVDTQDFASGVNSLSAEVALDNQIEALHASRAFGNSLLSCADSTAPHSPFDIGECVYLRATGSRIERDATSDNLGFDATTWGIATGGQRALGNDWFVGAALAYQNSSLTSDASRASSDGDRLFVGLSGKRVSGPFELAAAGHVGYGSYDISRNPITGGTVSGTQKQWSASGRLRAAYLHESGNLFVKPRVDLALDHFFGSDFTETGGGNALSVSLDSETYVSLQPAIEIGATMKNEDGTVWRPGITVGLTQYLGNPGPSLSAGFAGNPAIPFSHSTGIDGAHLDLAATLDVFTANAVTFRAEAGASFSDNSTAYGGDIKIEFRF